MDSPITHEKIIEVLRDVTTAGNHAASQLVKRLGPDFVEDYFPATTSPGTALNQMGDIVSYDFWVIWSAAMNARDLYQRLQAEKEVGDDAKLQRRVDDLEEVLERAKALVRRERDYISAIAGTMQPGLARTQLEGVSGELDHLGEDLARASRPHVAPPASANAGTGRATDWTYDWDDKIAQKIATGAYTGWKSDYGWEVILSSLEDDIATERHECHQRGLAEGERIGIEKAAKVADDIPAESYDTDYLFGWAAGRHSAAAAIRALTGDPQT